MDERRWFVDTTDDQREDVGAESCEVYPSGALVFTNKDFELTFAYAPGTWKFVEFQD